MYNPLLLTDFYKTTHERQYNPDMTYIYSVGTPRLSRLSDVDKITYFGGQAFCYEYLQKAFNERFFDIPENEVMKEYNDLLSYTIGEGTYNEERIRSLHRLGYLPIAMYAVPEGVETAIGVLMPQGEQSDIQDSYRVCQLLGIRYYRVNIGDTCNALYAALPSINSQIKTNTPARIRMATLYAIAAIEGARVVNTGNRSEAYVGYTTKWGDGAGDFALFTEYTVREVLAIGDAIGLPYDLVHKAPADGMSGLTDEDNLGFTYEDVDSWLLDRKKPPEEVLKRHRASQHKRQSIDLPCPLNL